MELQDLLRTGKDMLDEVSDAVDRGNYTHLNDSLKEMTRRMYEQQQRAARQRQEQMERLNRQMFGTGSGQTAETQQKNPQTGKSVAETVGEAISSAARQVGESVSRAAASVIPKRRPMPFLQRQISHTKGLASRILGILGAAACTPFVIVCAVTLFTGGGVFSTFLGGLLIFGIAEAACIYATERGRFTRRLIRDYYQYGKAVGSREYIGLDELGNLVGQNTEQVHHRLDQMMRRGFLPQARYDAAETTLMLTPSAYEMYQKAEEGRRQARAEEQKQEEQLQAAGKLEKVQQILKEGESYITFVRRCNDEIPGEEMSDKLEHLENITGRIFEQVRKNPSSADNLQKFMEYYLPVTRKLLNAYVELENQPAGENVQETRQEIEEAMDTVNEAFEALLDDMFEDMAWDVSSDISAMKTMMAQDGLTGEGSI